MSCLKRSTQEVQFYLYDDIGMMPSVAAADAAFHEKYENFIIELDSKKLVPLYYIGLKGMVVSMSLYIFEKKYLFAMSICIQHRLKQKQQLGMGEGKALNVRSYLQMLPLYKTKTYNK
jgi:hypothetical protein